MSYVGTRAQLVLDTWLVLEVLWYLLFTVKPREGLSLNRVCNAVRPDILITVDHGDFDILSDVTSSPSLLTLKHRLKCIYLFISHFLSRSNLLIILTVNHPHLMVFVAVACCLGHAKNCDQLKLLQL